MSVSDGRGLRDMAMRPDAALNEVVRLGRLNHIIEIYISLQIKMPYLDMV